MNRDLALERELVDIAARAAGLPIDLGLNEFAEYRAHPGPVRLPRDFDREVAEELADARSYLVWAVQRDYDRFLAGDPAATDAYERRMRCLSALVIAWRELHTSAS